MAAMVVFFVMMMAVVFLVMEEVVLLSGDSAILEVMSDRKFHGHYGVEAARGGGANSA